MAEPPYDALLDTSGERCPIPILRTQRQLKQLNEGQVLKIISTDRGSTIDFPVFCEKSGHRLVHMIEPSGALLPVDTTDDARWVFWLEKRTRGLTPTV